jgi:hypothetical protein
MSSISSYRCPVVVDKAMAKKKNPHAVALGKMGGSKGGKIRAARLSPERRREIAQKAIRARWAKFKKSPEVRD